MGDGGTAMGDRPRFLVVYFAMSRSDSGALMPRRARLTLPNVPMHVIQRGNNRQACFFADDDYAFYLACLKEYVRQAGGPRKQDDEPLPEMFER